MYYEINVSLGGRHFFATAERSVTTESKARAVFDELKARFPEAQGYKVTVSYNELTGRQLGWK